MAHQDITGVKPFLGAALQRFSSQFGIGSSPTNVEITVVEDYQNDPNAHPETTGFLRTLAQPGNITGFKYGAFDFIGIITNWQKDYGEGGWTYRVRLSDPRSVMGDIPIILDSTSPTVANVPNCLNAFAYYGGPQAADRTKDGMAFRRIKDYLETTGYINLYGVKFRLLFSTGYANSSGTTNPSGVAEWYRVTDSITSVNALIDNVSQDLGYDWYAYIKTDVYDATGLQNRIVIQHIDRNVQVTGYDLAGYISGAIDSGTLKSFQYGQELRTDSYSAIVLGDKKRYWYTPSTASILPYWGRATNGSAIYPTDSNLSDGMVLLDHLRGSGTERFDSNFLINYLKIDIVQNTNADIYPPSVTRGYSISQTTGYRPTPNVMRAAMISQKAWEAVLYKEQPLLAARLGITQIILPYADYIAKPQHVREVAELTTWSSGNFHRSPVLQNLCNAVYEATQSAVNEFWGKQFYVSLPTSAMFVSGNYDHSEIFPTIEYAISDSASCENKAYPTGVTNHLVLLGSHSSLFKDDIGRLKPFVSIPNYDNYNNPTQYPIDMSLINRDAVVIEQGDKLVVPIQVSPYEKDPTKAIMSIPYEIAGDISASGLGAYSNTLGYFKEFLRIFDYDVNTIDTYSLLRMAGANQEYGLGPPKLSGIVSVQENYGVHIPLMSNFEYFGPFFATGNIVAGINIVQDSSIAPWTFGSTDKMISGGQQLAQKATSRISVIDSASFVIAGVPAYNIGATIGNNANINGISVQLGSDGVTTNYSVNVFGLPILRQSKLLGERISQFYYLYDKVSRDVVDLTKQVDVLDRIGNNIFSPSDVRNAISASSNNKFIVGIHI